MSGSILMAPQLTPVELVAMAACGVIWQDTLIVLQPESRDGWPANEIAEK